MGRRANRCKKNVRAMGLVDFLCLIAAELPVFSHTGCGSFCWLLFPVPLVAETTRLGIALSPPRDESRDRSRVESSGV